MLTTWQHLILAQHHNNIMSLHYSHRIFPQISGFPPSLPLECDPAFLRDSFSWGQDWSGMDLRYNFSLIFSGLHILMVVHTDAIRILIFISDICAVFIRYFNAITHTSSVNLYTSTLRTVLSNYYVSFIVTDQFF